VGKLADLRQRHGRRQLAVNMSKATIEKLYASFASLDARGMASCYADDAVFEDEAFALRGRHQIGGMWSMLVDAIRKQGRKDWQLDVRDITERSAHWEPRYRFSATGRLVHNVIDAEFEFDTQGLIKRHRDRFSFWRWSRQALGLPGLLLGWTGFLRGKVRRGAARQLENYMKTYALPERRVG
jgi:SnoaL-like domain